ncbi:hypothetical protein NC651_003786 [Populus alba x Populus x berolinensis]|nr:hypothetical protein NC651_003786 [Populus alba x Populus x berolinensis]
MLGLCSNLLYRFLCEEPPNSTVRAPFRFVIIVAKHLPRTGLAIAPSLYDMVAVKQVIMALICFAIIILRKPTIVSFCFCNRILEYNTFPRFPQTFEMFFSGVQL